MRRKSRWQNRKFGWLLDPDGKLVIDKKLIDEDQRDQIGSIFTDYVKDFIGEEGGSSTPQQQEESTNNNSPTQTISQITPTCTGQGATTTNLGEVCNYGANGSDVIHQYNNKMITVTEYPTNTSQEGTAQCIKSDDREPEIYQIRFTCNADGSINWPNADLNNYELCKKNSTCQDLALALPQ